MTSRPETLEHALRTILCEPLRDYGFAFDGFRTFRRPAGGGILQIIDVQLGELAMAGYFTINLAVFVPGELHAYPAGGDARHSPRIREFHCSPQRRRRLGTLVPGRFAVLRGLPLIGALFGPRDIWWRYSEGRQRTEASLSAALRAIERHGLDWLAEATPRMKSPLPRASDPVN